MTDSRIELLLYESYDRPLNSREQKRLDSALKTDARLRDLQRKLQELNTGLAQHKVASFGPWFADRTMNKIQHLERRDLLWESLLNNLLPGFRRIALISSIIVVIILTFNFSTSSKPNIATVFGLNRMTLTELADPYNYFTLE